VSPVARAAFSALAVQAAVLASSGGLARADAPPADAKQPSPQRAVPDYSGRGPEPTTTGDVAIWVPRVILSPLYLVTEYVLRKPIGVLSTAAEKADLPRKTYDFFTYGPEHNAGWAPVGMYEFDFNPSVGVYVFWKDACFKGSNLHAHVEGWPTHWLGGNVTEHVEYDERHSLQLRVEADTRPDRVFYGIGPTTLQSNQSRYTENRVDAGGWYAWKFWRSSVIEPGAGYRSIRPGPGNYGGNPSVEQEAATNAFALPPGWEQATDVVYLRLLAALDSREGKHPEGSGVRIEADAEQGTNMNTNPVSGWVKYGGSVGGFLDLNQHGRVISLSVTALFTDPIGSQPIPFTEQVSLGGDGPMRGYFKGRLIDRSAAAATMRYLWPVAPWLEGTLQAALGNVFDEHLEGFKANLLRFSGSLGLSTREMGDYPMEAIIGFGSETFQQGGTIDSFRLTVSVNHGF
jgi:hypothetical protein